MTKKKGTSKGMMLVGRFKKLGITLYLRQGEVVGRTATSDARKSRTMPQFVQRQKMRHTIALWKRLRFCDQLYFTQHKTAYLNFASLTNRLPVVYVLKKLMKDASFLMPGIPVSDGTLPTIQLQLGEVNGVPALLTGLKAGEQIFNEKLLLYTAEQTIECKVPKVRFSMREVSRLEMTVVDGHLALVNEEFADEMKGWALVQTIDDRCSPQTIVTRCTLYQQYTTDEARDEALKSYGGLIEIDDDKFIQS